MCPVLHGVQGASCFCAAGIQKQHLVRKRKEWPGSEPCDSGVCTHMCAGGTWYGKVVIIAVLLLIFSSPFFWRILNLVLILW